MNTFRIWLDATRPKTLPAALMPVAVGTALAIKYGQFSLSIFIVTCVCSLLIQIGTNFANDYFDFKKGADNENRVGFKRASASGLIKPETMWKATLGTMISAFILGLYLVYEGGWIILLIGILSLLFGITYTGGPFPLAYNGLGDIFVFIFFGIIAVTGTFYLHTELWKWEVFWAAFVPGALSTAILVVNNLRDTETDKLANKNTIGVLFGDRFLQIEYVLLLITAYAILPHLSFWNSYSKFIFLPFITLPFGLFLMKSIFSFKEKSELNLILAKTALFLMIYCLLFSSAIIIES